MAGSGFNLNKLIDESKQTLLAPKAYFSAMAKTGGLVDPIIKAVVYGLVAGIITLILGLIGIGAAGVSTIIMTPIMALIGLFIGGIIILIISAICGGSTDFEANIRVTASISVLLPIQSLLIVFNSINFYLGAIVGLAVSLYGLWLLYLALTKSLSAKDNIAKIIVGIFAILSIILTVLSFGATRVASHLSNEATQNAEEMQKKAEQMMEKFMKENKSSEGSSESSE
ncbi:MAG: YIP1 family protein [Spirochaetes bacterium]|nr:YIP1 family protein [Spirochaetota bacterium]